MKKAPKHTSDRAPVTASVNSEVPLTKGKPLTREQSAERMYRKFAKAFAALAR